MLKYQSFIFSKGKDFFSVFDFAFNTVSGSSLENSLLTILDKNVNTLAAILESFIPSLKCYYILKPNSIVLCSFCFSLNCSIDHLSRLSNYQHVCMITSKRKIVISFENSYYRSGYCTEERYEFWLLSAKSALYQSTKV